MTIQAADLPQTGKSGSMALPSARRLLLWTGLAVLLAWVLVPIYFVALGAFGGRLGVFRWPKTIWPTDLSLAAMTQFLSIEGVFNALVNSLIAAGLTVLFSVLLGAPAGYALARFDFPGKRLVDALIDIPAVLPPSAAGIALLLAFGKLGLLGEYLYVLGIKLPFTMAAVVLAEIFVAAHFYVRQAAVRFDHADREVEEAAQVDGADRTTTFLRVTLPLAFPALLAGAVTAWARALGEFGGTIIFAGNFQGRTQTMPLAIYLGFELDLDVALTLSVILIGCSFGVLILVKGILQREVS